MATNEKGAAVEWFFGGCGWCQRNGQNFLLAELQTFNVVII
jgi:hypothetical protein